MYALGLGLLAIVVIMQFDYTFLKKFSIPVMAGTLLLLIAVLVIGEVTFGAIRGLRKVHISRQRSPNWRPFSTFHIGWRVKVTASRA